MNIITVMQLDFNLLNALDALLEEGSVAGAATRMHLSQPAMSRTLGRIREVTGDQIMVRAGHRMEPTTYAASIREQVHAVVRQTRELLTPSREVDIASLQRTFTIRCNEVVATAIGARLITRVQSLAPGVRLRILAETSLDTNDLQQGRVDLELNAGVPAAADLRHEVIHQDRMSIAVHPKHPWTKGRFTAKRFSQGQHVIVSRRGRLRDAVDAKLEALGLRRQVLAALPTSTAALSFVRDCESAVTIPELMCRPMVDLFRLRLLRLPLDLDPIPLMSTWHLRYDRDPTHIWIRTQVRDVIQSTLQNQRLIT
jgi:DNA-binding transcriptional LysR family regulator